MFRQSNHEGELIDWIQEARTEACALVINPAGYGHTSVAILDALNTFDHPVIEVHISNVHKREEFRHHSFVSKRADGVIAPHPIARRGGHPCNLAGVPGMPAAPAAPSGSSHHHRHH